MPDNKRTSRAKRKATSNVDHCEYCGHRRGLQRHRIIPGREGGQYVLGNVIVLCPNDHYDADTGYIAREELLEIVAKRIASEIQ